MTNQVKPNVMVLIGNFRNNSGGAQRAIANQIRHAPNRCRYFVCHFFGEGTLAKDLPMDVRVLSLGASSAMDPRIIPRLRRLYDKHQINVVHTQSPISGFWGRLSCLRRPDIRLISTEQNSHQRYRNLTGLLNGITLPLADEIVCVSESTRKSFFFWEDSLLNGRQRLTIYNAIDIRHYSSLKRDRAPELRRELGLTKDDLILGNVARLDSQKNQAHMIREFETIAKQFPHAKILIIGRGGLKASLSRLIDSLGVSEQVRLLGPRVDMDSIYRMLDVFLLPSLHEGFSVALLEAMACGLPIVCSNIPQIIEATADAALTADPTKSGHLAAAMKRMVVDHSCRIQYSTAAKNRARTLFDARAMARQYESLYRQRPNTINRSTLKAAS